MNLLGNVGSRNVFSISSCVNNVSGGLLMRVGRAMKTL